MADTPIVDLNPGGIDYVKAAKARQNALPPEVQQALVHAQRPLEDPSTGLSPGEAGPPIPSFFGPSETQMQRTALPPPEVNGVIGGILEEPSTPQAPGPTNPADNLDAMISSVAQPSNTGLPKVAPRPKTLGEKILPFLKLAGVIGGGLEASGHPMQRPEGAELLHSSLQAEHAREMEAAKLQGVDIPLAQAHAEYFKQTNPTKQAVANTAAGAKIQSAEITQRYKAVPGVGLFDTQLRQIIPGTQQGVIITPDMAKDYQLPNDFIGKPMKLTDLSGLENAISRNLTTVQGAKGPALVNKRQGTGKDLGLGSPAAAGAANATAIVRRSDGQGGSQLVAISRAEQLRTGEPSANVEFAQEGPTPASRNMSQMATTVLPKLEHLSNSVDELAPYLGPAIGRLIVQGAAGKIGSTGSPALDARLGALIGDFKLISSAVGRTHFGGRTGLPASQYFEGLFSGARSPEELKGIIGSVKPYIESYSDMQEFTPKRLGGQTGGGTKGGGGKALDDATAKAILQEAGGDPAKARALAKQRGYKIGK